MDWFDRVGLLLACSGAFGCRRYPPPVLEPTLGRAEA